MSDKCDVGTMLGYGADGSELRVGDRVKHAEKGFVGGVIVSGGQFYKGEAACIVDFPEHMGWLARLSKLVPAPKTVEDFGYSVGQKVEHLKYTNLNPMTITSAEVGEYKGEPCCFTGNNRATRFSQIKPWVEPEAAEPEAPAVPEEGTTFGLDDLLKALDDEARQVFTFTRNGSKITLIIE